MLPNQTDTKLIEISHNSYVTGKKTDPNIYYNIMNYNYIKINGKVLRDLWKNKNAELLTLEQIQQMVKEIDFQKKGAGVFSVDDEKAYYNYWEKFPGKPVEQKKQ
jgi:hypothetical protein